MNFKRTLCTLALTLGIATFSSPANAESYFGIRLESIVIIPVFGVQLGYDFDDDGSGRFGLRGMVESLLGLLNRGALDATYRFNGNADGSAAYAGAGAGVLFTTGITGTGSSVAFAPEIHGLIGYEFMLPGQSGIFIEGQFGVLINTYSSSSLAPFGTFAAGFNLHF